MMIGYLVTIEVMVKDHDEWVMVEKPCYCLLLRKAMKKAKSLHEKWATHYLGETMPFYKNGNFAYAAKVKKVLTRIYNGKSVVYSHLEE